MQKITIWVCEMCDNQYDDPTSAKVCEVRCECVKEMERELHIIKSFDIKESPKCASTTDALERIIDKYNTQLDKIFNEPV